MMHDRFKIQRETTQLAPVLAVVEKAKVRFAQLLEQCEATGGLTIERYRRYLVFQHHLTKDVQRPFLALAGHPSLAARRSLRNFLFQFALEEEPHYSIATSDLAALGYDPGDAPLDVRLWWAYFDRVVPERPFVRLGATCVLENLGVGSASVARRLLGAAGFVTLENSRFIQIHFHEALPHGDQVLWALDAVPLSRHEIDDLVQGAAEATVLYLRLAAWALQLDSVHDDLGLHYAGVPVTADTR